MHPKRKQPGFAEEKQDSFSGAADLAVAQIPKRELVKLAEGGRFVIPAAMREAMGVAPGDKLILCVEDGELRVRGQRAAIKRAQRIARKYKKPGENIVDEFLQERRKLWGEE